MLARFIQNVLRSTFLDTNKTTKKCIQFLNKGEQIVLLYLTLYIIYNIKVMFLQKMPCSMSVRKCMRFCIPELQS